MKRQIFRAATMGITVLAAATVGTAWAVVSSGSAWAPYLTAEEDWDDVTVSDDVDYRTLRRTVTTVERIVIQRAPLQPTYAIALGVDVPTATTCGDNTIVFVPAGDGDLTDSSDEDLGWQLLDSAKLALLTGKSVAVVIDPGTSKRATSGCLRPMLMRLAVTAG